MNTDYACRYLTGRKQKTFLAACDRIIPPDGQSPLASDIITAQVVDWALGKAHATLRNKFLVLLVVVEILGLFFGGRFFSANSEKARDRQLAWMENAPVSLFRLGFFGLKSYACMGYYTREEVWKSIDYDGPIEKDRAFAEENIRALCQAKEVSL